VNKFWCFSAGETGRALYLNGPISDETWWGDEITPAAFREELLASQGDITVWINSPGGCVFAAAEIYTALKEYPGRVTVKITGMCASAASVVAMAGAEVLMSPVSYMVIHNPSTIAIGDSAEMLRAKATLDEIKEGIINAYQAKTRLPREEISRLMNEESCFNAKKAVQLGFADDVLYENQSVNDSAPVIFSRMSVMNSLLAKIPQPVKQEMSTPGIHNDLEELEARLQKLKI